jgi:CBS-domain-containing membrane protein
MKEVAHIVPEVSVLELVVAFQGADEAAHAIPALDAASRWRRGLA